MPLSVFKAVNEMKKITQMPRIVLTYGLTALIVLVSSLFISGSIDIAIHDTYVVIAKVHVVLAIALLFVFFSLTIWGIHKISRRLSSVLNWFHYGLTTISLAIIAVLMNELISQPPIYRDYSVFDEIEEYEAQTSVNEWLAIIGVIFIFSQLLFLINIIRAFIVKK